MAMDLRNPDVWLAHLLENLPEDKLSAALDDGNADWEFVDSEIVKLGSLAHSQSDIPELQRRARRFWPQKPKSLPFRTLPGMLRQYSAMLCWRAGKTGTVLAGAQRS